MPLLSIITFALICVTCIVYILRITYRSVTFEHTKALEAIELYLNARHEREVWRENNRDARRSSREYQRLLRVERRAYRDLNYVLSRRYVFERRSYHHFIEEDTNDLKPVS